MQAAVKLIKNFIPIHLLLYRDYLKEFALRKRFPDIFEFFDRKDESLSSYLEEFSKIASSNGKRVWIGEEHPRLGFFLAYLIGVKKSRNVLEVGYQSGGSAIPIIGALGNNGGTYVGMDNEENDYAKGSHLLIDEYLRKKGIVDVRHQFIVGDALESLKSASMTEKFDMIFIDHAKNLYEPTLKIILERDLCHKKTIFLFHDIYNYAREFMPSIYRHFGVHIQIPQIREGLAVCLYPKD